MQVSLQKKIYISRYSLPQQSDQLTLSNKNILVLKVIFNVAHCIGGYLGASWFILLKNFQKLDKFLNSRKLKVI